jgi:adenylate cyclase
MIAVASPAAASRSATHRHAAVAFADLVGYTLLMSLEPERTHARWMELLFGVPRPGDEASCYFANGMIEDIVLSLGALSDLAVTARSATIGRVPGVRHVLTGTLRKGNDRLLLTSDLRDCTEGEVLWSDRFETGLPDLFAVQDEMVGRVVGGIAPSIRAAELRKAPRTAPSDLTAYDHTLRGMHALDALRRDTFDDARDHMHQAIRRDPGFAAPVSWASRWRSFAFSQAWSANPRRELEPWGSMAAKAVELDPRNAMGHVMFGHHQARALHDPQGALAHDDRALAVCPNNASALSLKSGALSYLGRGDEALPLAERARWRWRRAAPTASMTAASWAWRIWRAATMNRPRAGCGTPPRPTRNCTPRAAS